MIIDRDLVRIRDESGWRGVINGQPYDIEIVCGQFLVTMIGDQQITGTIYVDRIQKGDQ